MDANYTLVRNIVYSSYPRHLSVDVPLDVTLQVDLRVDLDAVSFNKDHVILWDMKEKKSVPIDVTYKRRCIIVETKSDLDANSHYQLELVGGPGKGIKVITDDYLEQSWSMEFYTAEKKSMEAPAFTSPANQTAVAAPVAFTWNEVENTFYYHMQISESNTFNHILWPTEPDTNVYDGKATPDFDYKENQRYYARIKAVSILNEESAWSDVIQFYIEPEEEEQVETIPEEYHDPAYYLESRCRCVSSELDSLQEALAKQLEKETGVKVKAISIKHGSVHVPLDKLTEIHIEFAEKINPKSIISDTVYLIGERN